MHDALQGKKRLRKAGSATEDRKTYEEIRALTFSCSRTRGQVDGLACPLFFSFLCLFGKTFFHFGDSVDWNSILRPTFIHTCLDMDK